MEIDTQDVLDLIRVMREEPDPKVRAGMYIAAVYLDLVTDDPDD